MRYYNEVLPAQPMRTEIPVTFHKEIGLGLHLFDVPASQNTLVDLWFHPSALAIINFESQKLFVLPFDR